jgi:hypothetical protein
MANRPLPKQPTKSKTNESQFKMTKRRKKGSSRPKEEREKEFKMKSDVCPHTSTYSFSVSPCTYYLNHF